MGARKNLSVEQTSVLLPKDLLNFVRRKAKENERTVSREITYNLKKMYNLDIVEDVK